MTCSLFILVWHMKTGVAIIILMQKTEPYELHKQNRGDQSQKVKHSSDHSEKKREEQGIHSHSPSLWEPYKSEVKGIKYWKR